jgi:hypothetical protein
MGASCVASAGLYLALLLELHWVCMSSLQKQFITPPARLRALLGAQQMSSGLCLAAVLYVK